MVYICRVLFTAMAARHFNRDRGEEDDSSESQNVDEQEMPEPTDSNSEEEEDEAQSLPKKRTSRSRVSWISRKTTQIIRMKIFRFSFVKILMK